MFIHDHDALMSAAPGTTVVRKGRAITKMVCRKVRGPAALRPDSRRSAADAGRSNPGTPLARVNTA